jgi:hypothetical protein
MEPLDGAVVIVARDHMAERNAAADAVQRLIGIHLLKLSDWLYRVRLEIFVFMSLQVEVFLEHL